MFRKLRWALFFVLIAGPAAAATCGSKKDDDSIAGCTGQIARDKITADTNPGLLASDYERRAVAYDHKGMSDEAKADYDAAVALKPDFITWFNRGQFLVDAGEMTAATADLTKAITQYEATPPNKRGDWTQDMYLQAYFQRAEALRRDEHFAEAVADYNKVIAAQPRNDIAITNRALAYSHLGRLDEDIADLTRVMALKRPDAVTLYNRGLAYVRKGDDADALADFSDAIQRTPGMAVAYVARGSVLEHMNQPAKALDDYRMAVRLDPKLPSAAAALARLDRP